MDDFAHDGVPLVDPEIGDRVESCNPAKLSSELLDSEKSPRAQYHWYCWECGTGPMGLEGPVFLEGRDTGNILDAEEKCIRYDCLRAICKECTILPLSQCNIGGEEYQYTTAVDGLALSEQKLAVFTDMDSTPLDTCRNGAPEYMLGLSLSELLWSPSLSTPGLTISSAASPDSGGVCEEEELATPRNLDQRMKEKKSECMLKLADTWYKRWAKHNKNEDTTLKPPEGSFISKLEDPKDFLLVWQQAIIPFLAAFVPEWCGPNYTIGIRRAQSPNLRLINIATEEAWSDTEGSHSIPCS